MALKVIGAGFGRTGTLSLKTALERLGLDGCYHMAEVFGHPEHADVWAAAGAGEPVDWDSLFEGYQATVDWPACAYWPELVEAYPDAKVLLNVRDPQRWWDSFRDTIYAQVTRPDSDRPETRILMTVGAGILERSFGGQLGDRDYFIACYERHNEAVVRGVPADRLLVYQVSEGWEPLCAFLGLPVPDEPFPNVNDRAFFRAIFGLDGEA